MAIMAIMVIREIHTTSNAVKLTCASPASLRLSSPTSASVFKLYTCKQQSPRTEYIHTSSSSSSLLLLSWFLEFWEFFESCGLEWVWVSVCTVREVGRVRGRKDTASIKASVPLWITEFKWTHLSFSSCFPPFFPPKSVSVTGFSFSSRSFEAGEEEKESLELLGGGIGIGRVRGGPQTENCPSWPAHTKCSPEYWRENKKLENK